VVDETRESVGNHNVATEFLLDFPHDGRSGILAGFDFSTGKFPLQWQVFVRRALGEQQQPVALDQRANHWNGNRNAHDGLLNKARRNSATFLWAPVFFNHENFP